MRDRGLSFHKIATRPNSDACGDRRESEIRNPGSEAFSMTSPRNDKHLIRMAVIERKMPSHALVQCWNTAQGVLFFAPRFVNVCYAIGFLCAGFPLKLNYGRLQLQWVHQSSHLRADVQQVIFSNETCYNPDYNDARVFVRC